MNIPTYFISHNIYIRYSLRAFMMYAILVLFAISPLQLNAAFSKHSTSIVKTIDSNYSGTVDNILRDASNFLNPSETSYYYSGTKGDDTYTNVVNFTVELNESDRLTKDDEEDLVVYIRRPKEFPYSANLNEANPTVFDVKCLYYKDDGKLDISNAVNFKVYFQYRGPLTHEYSARIPIKKIFEKNTNLRSYQIVKLRFFAVTNANDSRYSVRSNGIRDVALNSFDVLKIPHDEPYSDTFVDNFHLQSDYGKTFEDYEFVNTQGIADSRNSIDGWQMLNDSEIERLSGMGITYPDYSFITSSSNKSRNPYPLNGDQKRQPAHTVEHIIYAMPGDVIPLYPYYGLSHTAKFKENFSHWYEYKSGGIPEYTTNWSGEKVQLLDFLTDPSCVQKTTNHGYYGGKYMNAGDLIVYKIYNVEDYIEAVNKINSSSSANNVVELCANLDFANRSDIPILGDNYVHRFYGIFNGNGYTISNLTYDSPNTIGVGLIGYADGATVENVVLDNSCRFVGDRRVGAIIGECDGGFVNIRNIHSDATIIGKQTAAGLVGEFLRENNSMLTIENCYIGGKITNPEGTNNTSNAAVVAGIKLNNSNNLGNFKNIVVACELSGSDQTKPYVRHDLNIPTVEENGAFVKDNLRVEYCYGNIIDNERCWILYPVPADLPPSVFDVTDSMDWTDYKTPKMDASVTGSYSSIRQVENAAEYVALVNEINNNNLTNILIEFTGDLNFEDYDETEVPMIYEGKQWCSYRCSINGNGHTISNLKIKRQEERVGLYYWVGSDIEILNLILDSSCDIETANSKNMCGIIAQFNGGKLTIRNLQTEATFRADYQVGAIIGRCQNDGADNCFDFKNIYLGGYINNKWPEKSGVLFGEITFSGTKKHSNFENIIVDCQINKIVTEKWKKYICDYNSGNVLSYDMISDGVFEKKIKNTSFVFKNCYGNLDAEDIGFQPFSKVIIRPLTDYIKSWGENYVLPVYKDYYNKVNYELLKSERGNRKAGTVATFFCPRDPFAGETIQSLPMQEGEDEYVIAADFSQTFNPNKNIDNSNKKLYEPIVAFRHIFRIRDGKKFADEISGSVESNSNYLRKTRKYVSARAGVPFQLRLETPVPKPNGSKIPPSHYYYVNENGEYQQVAKMHFRVLDAATRNVTTKMSFKFDNIYPGYGFREIDGVKYALGEGSYLSKDKHPDYDKTGYDATKEAEYYLLLASNSAVQGHYIVQILAQDYHDNDINIQGTSTPLVLMEYDINILPAEGAWMIAQEELYGNEGYKVNSPEELDKKYATQSFKIDFDEYMKINQLQDSDPLKNKLISWSTYVQTDDLTSNPGPDATKTSNGMEKTWFKWPRPWDKSTYIFGYNDRQDYSMYQLATHSENVIWKMKAQQFPESTNATSFEGNNPGDGMGLFDRRYYASKLNKARSGEPEQGYFYYVNAASDPGVAANLNIDDLCPGSRIVVSAWMAEFSKSDEKGNLSFNFVAVLKDDVYEKYPTSGFVDGERVILHKFISGYPEAEGKWYNIYYSFTPRLAEFSSYGVTKDMVDHYELELDNNSRSSNGADYAIDDIRAYVVPPTVEAKQLSPACDNEEIRMQLASPFETLLEIAGKKEKTGTETEKLSVYYTYLDKEEFDKKYYENGGSSEEAFDASIIKFNYNISNKDDRKYGIITFDGNYSKNPVYRAIDASGKIPDPIFGKAYVETRETGERMIVFESEISSGKLTAGKEYYVVFKSALGDADVPETGKESEFFKFKNEDPCANTGEFFIVPSNVVKINGYVPEDLANITVCENQIPVIQMNVWGTNEKGESKELGKNVYFDWFYGTINEFNSYNDGTPQHTLKDALGVFRTRYPKAENLDGIKADKVKPEGKEQFYQWMLDIIRKAIDPGENNGLPKLTLCSTSYLMPSVDLTDGTPQARRSVVVIPISAIIEEELSAGSDKEYLFCTSPTELGINFGNSAPSLKHGLTDINYPDDLTDVPLRIGLDQLKTDLIQTNGRASRILDIPVRFASSSKGSSSRKLKLVTEPAHVLDQYKNSTEVQKEGAVILVQTNDPEYKDLGTLDKNNEETGTPLWVGDIKKLQAETNKENVTQYFQVEFDKDFNFKEGYFYRFRFQFEEEGSESDENVCAGQDVFTLKIVPRYLAWTGENSLNWNDDGNWRRVKNNDLNLSGHRPAELAHYITNGLRGIVVNPNTKAYAPLDFTHVIVESGMEGPFMYSPTVMREDKVKDEYDGTKKYVWPSDPEKGTAKLQDDDPGADAVGKVTPLIHYDMAAFEFGTTKGRNDAEVGCRPWYANTCNEIHFKPGGTIMNQQELTYNKAWVDIELDHSRWQTVSTPLQEVYAGDFYLPSDGARQKTELYQDITFSKGTNDRFKPAVFQRGWDKSEAKVYEIDGPAVNAADVRNVAVKTFWSHVYNDVKDPYGGGVGFSIKTDITDMTAANKPNADGKVLFRLPKADTEYLYWNKDGSKSGHKTEITRGSGQYRLNDSQGTITVETATEGNYFLVGNPFMTHMDIKKFLERNENNLKKKYWVITKNGQIAGSFDDEAVAVADPADEEGAEDPTVVAPMQGFFVMSKTPKNKLELLYDKTMMRRYTSDKTKHLTDSTRSESASMLRIVAEADGLPTSAALLGVNNGSNWNVEAIDNRDLDIPSVVYTVGDGMALSINSVGEAEGTEIGVIADEDTETLLRFEGVECLDGMYLLDKADHSLTPLEEGLEVMVEGAAAGRFFLTYGIAEEGILRGIEWSVNGGVLTAVDNAASGHIEVNVYDTVGRPVKHEATTDNVIDVQLESGIYVVEIATAKERETAKIRIAR